MPTYDYKCTSCGTVTEKFHAISETPQVACDQCGAEMSKQIGMGAGIVYKGSGFYTTDYKNSGSSSSSAAPAASSCSTGACGCN